MSGAKTLIETLKHNLKSRGITYSQLAKKWDLSEASVKRIMSEGDISLDRIESACELMGIRFSELIKLTPFDVETTEQTLLPEQEEIFAKEPRLCHFWFEIREGKTLKQIEKEFVISKAEIQKFLIQLDRMQLIELHPKNKIKVIGQNRSLLRREGPLGKVILEQAKTSFLNHSFKSTQQEHLRFCTFSLNPMSAIRYKAKIEKMIHEIRVESEIEKTHPESIEFGLLAAIRPWSSPLAQAMEKRKK